MKRFLPLLPSALLCLVAVGQVYLVRTEHLTPWKGGGFGMFSTNDHHLARRIQVWVNGSEWESEVDLSDDPTVGQLTFHPSVKRLTAMATRIARVEQARGTEVQRVRVVVSRRDFDVETLQPREVLVGEMTIEPGRASRP